MKKNYILIIVVLIAFAGAAAKSVIAEPSKSIAITDVVEKPNLVSDPSEINRIRRSEVYPDLSDARVSFLPAVPNPGDKVSYTVSIQNKGNIKGSGVDVFLELPSFLENYENFNFINCGDESNAEGEGGELEISNVDVKKKQQCEIRFQATVPSNYNGAGGDESNLYISPAAEGGVEIGPVPAGKMWVSHVAPAEPEPEAEAETPAEEPATEPEVEDGLNW